jgi:hypothetical protein
MKLAIAPAIGRKEVRGRHTRASAVAMTAGASRGVDVLVNEMKPRNRAMPTCSRCVRRVGAHVSKALAREATWKRLRRLRNMAAALTEKRQGE